MTRIAARAGINKERRYSYFGDKDAPWSVALAEELDRLVSAVRVVRRPRRLRGRDYNYHARHPELGRGLQWEDLTGPPPLTSRVLGHYRDKVGASRMPSAAAALTEPESGPPRFALIALAAWWEIGPQLAQIVTRAGGDNPRRQRQPRRAFVVEAAWPPVERKPAFNSSSSGAPGSR